MNQFFNQPDFEVLRSGIHSASMSGTLGLLVLAIAVACFFEFINGFHDTANAVATVIYTRSLKPWPAVIWSGICNFIGVFLGGITVAMGIIKLLPMDLLTSSNATLSLITVFSMLASSCIWNLGTWMMGLPASSSHALVGAILGVGVGNALSKGLPASAGVNWGKAGEIGLSLLISPVLGFLIAGAGLLLLKRVIKNPTLHRSPGASDSPPLPIRLALITTSSGVSLAHGSNDGQKGVGLVMLILIAILPGHFALSPLNSKARMAEVKEAAQQIENKLTYLRPIQPAAPVALITSAHAETTAPVIDSSIFEASNIAGQIEKVVSGPNAPNELKPETRLALRAQILQLESKLSKLEKSGYNLSELKSSRKVLSSLVEYAPAWVIIMIALSLGLGTMIGWKRIVTTLGEKIGKTHLTYAQGAVSEVVAMSMIGVSAMAGVPVSTTHCLSAGIAGSMVATGSGVQSDTVKKIIMAWVLTLPATLALSAGTFLTLRHFLN